MKHILRPLVLLAGFGLLGILPAAAQITITAADIGDYFLPGNVTTSRIDTTTHSVNIGGLGATSWDFSGLVTSYSAATVTVDPETTAFYGAYPAATHAIKVGSGYTYFSLGSNLEMLGYAQGPPTEIRSHQRPPQVLNDLPMTMGTSWTSSYVDSSFVTISGTTYTTVTSHTVVNTVDAYGNLTIPGGSSYAALRLKSSRTSQNGVFTFHSITYQFLTKEGASVTVVPSDTNQPPTGTIATSNASWVDPSGTTAVREIPGTVPPSEYLLEQNYPNPFNPSTTIGFALPERSRVSLKVFNLIGEEVAELVSGELAPGRHSVVWDGTGYPSGVYVYRLQSGSFSSARSFLLVR